MDVPPLAPNCGGYIHPLLSSYKESCYFLGVIPCHCLYDSCFKPCFGETVCHAPCYCPAIGCEMLCQRCCSIPLIAGVTNSENFKEIITAQMRKVQTSKK